MEMIDIGVLRKHPPMRRSRHQQTVDSKVDPAKSKIERTTHCRSTPPARWPPTLTALQLMNWLTLQLVRHIVPMQLSYRKESRLACVSHRFASTGLHHAAAFLSVLCPLIPSGIPTIFLYEPASSYPEPDDQAEDDQEDDDGYGDCDGKGLGGNSAAAAATTTAAAAVVASTSSCCFGGRVCGRAARTGCCRTLSA